MLNYKYIKIICIFLIIFLCLEAVNLLYLYNSQNDSTNFIQEEAQSESMTIDKEESKEELCSYSSSLSSSYAYQSMIYLQEEIEKEDVIPTLYDTLTSQEIELIELTVQHEVGNFSKDYKKLIAAIVRNRLESEQFPNTISEVILAKGQFSDGNYYGIIIDEETKEAVQEVFSMEESPHKATYYYNPDLSSYSSICWFEYSGDIEYLFSYTEEDWGVVYTTRFFI